jgi:hypothetical protein
VGQKSRDTVPQRQKPVREKKKNLVIFHIGNSTCQSESELLCMRFKLKLFNSQSCEDLCIPAEYLESIKKKHAV